MLKSAIFSTLIVTIISLSFLCTGNGPTAGIETGNPAMTACAKTALSLLSDNSVWQPAAYLVSGKEQLDPSTILPTKSSSPLAKQTASANTDSSTINEKTFILQRVDTIINVSKVFVNDTIIKTSTRSDTTTQSERPSATTDTTTIITEKLITTKIVVVDTITVYDTFTVTHYDTIKSGDMMENTSSKTTAPGTIITTTQPEASVIPVTKEMDVYLDIISSTKRFSVPANYSSNITESYSKISRTGAVGLLTLSEVYSDGDGDGNLLAGKSGTVPIADLHAEYSLQNEQQSLLVRFDAGNDKLFSKITDNRVHSLHRVKKIDNTIGEEISYTKIQSFSSNDSSLLTVSRSNPIDSISSATIHYSIISPDPSANQAPDKLASVHYTAQYRKGNFISIKMDILPDLLIGAETTLTSAKIRSFIDFGKGSGGVFEGVINYAEKQVYGTYSENGTEFDFLFNATTNESSFLKK